MRRLTRLANGFSKKTTVLCSLAAHDVLQLLPPAHEPGNPHDTRDYCGSGIQAARRIVPDRENLGARVTGRWEARTVPKEQPMKDDAVLAGRLMAFIVFSMGLALMARTMTRVAWEDLGWVAISTLIVPLGIACLLFMAAEIVRALRES